MSDSGTSEPVYLDHHATTPVDPRVLESMLPYFTDVFGNAASIDHVFGSAAAEAVKSARAQVAKTLNAKPKEIIFTSGATEANNLALTGAAEAYNGEGRHIITVVTEHPAVLDPCQRLEARGWRITRLPVDVCGEIDLTQLEEAISEDTVLVSVMAANNEIGVVAPLVEIGEITRRHGVLFHTDATQGTSYLSLDVEDQNIDLLSLSGHKVYGPKGVGALFVRSRRPRVKVAEQIHGGGHERGMRSGTLNVPGIVGLGAAMELASKVRTEEGPRLQSLRNRMWEALQERLPGVELNGHSTRRLPNNLSFSIPNVESRSMILLLNKKLGLSTGSACATAKVEPSHVIEALGFGAERAFTSLRIGLGRTNTAEDVDYALECIVQAATRLSRLG